MIKAALVWFSLICLQKHWRSHGSCKYNCNSKIYHLYKASTPECNFDYSAKEYWNMIADQCSNSFWKNVFTYWRDYTSLLVPTNREQVLCSSIWNNINIKVGSKAFCIKLGTKVVLDMSMIWCPQMGNSCPCMIFKGNMMLR